MIKVIYHYSYHKEKALKGKNSLPREILSFKSSLHLKRDVIEENHCLIQ